MNPNPLAHSAHAVGAASVLCLRWLTPQDRPAWDVLTQRSEASCFMQSWAWADFKEKEGYRTFRYGFFLDERLVGGCIVYCYLHNAQVHLLNAVGGPYLPQGYEAEALSQWLSALRVLAQQVGAIAVRIEPLWSTTPPYLEGFVRAPVDTLPLETLWIDLQPDPVAILHAMKPKGRYNIRVSQRHGVETRFTSDLSDLPVFYDVFWATAQRQQFWAEPYGFFINLCQTLMPEGMAEIGFAERKGQVLAAILVVYWGKQATYLYGGRTEDCPSAMASYGLHWAAMQRAKAKGCHYYDFYGISTHPNHSYARFSRFKHQFGGQVVTTLGAQDYYFYDRLADTLIGILTQLQPRGATTHGPNCN